MRARSTQEQTSVLEHSGKKSSCGQLQPQTIAENNNKTTRQKNNAFLRKQAGRTEGPAQSAVRVGSLYLAGAKRGMKL